MWITAGLDLSWLWWHSFSCCWSHSNARDKPIACVWERSWELGNLASKMYLKVPAHFSPQWQPLSLFLLPGLGALVVVLSTVMEQLLRCEGSCLCWFSPPAASGREPTTSLSAFQSNQNTSTNHTVTKSFGCFRWKDLCPQRLGQPIIAHSLCLPTSYDCSFHLIFNVAVALPHEAPGKL